MDLLDRYLATIRHNLPAARADDIVEELRGDLLERVEGREEALGRPLDAAETAAIIKDYGPPLMVAGRYGEHQYLIGPQAYPYYQYGLRVTVVIALAVFFFSAVVPAVAGSGDAIKAVLHGLGNVWTALFASFTIVTVFFAVAERSGLLARHIAAWNPAHLPSYAEQKKSKWESPFEVGLGLLLLLFWSGIIPVSMEYRGNGVHLAPAPVWSAYYWPVLILAAARLAYNVINWLRPNWQAARAVLGLGTLLGGIALVGRLRQDGPWVIATALGTGDGAVNAARFGASINMTIGIALLVALIAWGIGLAMLAYQLYLRRFMVGR